MNTTVKSRKPLADINPPANIVTAKSDDVTVERYLEGQCADIVKVN